MIIHANTPVHPLQRSGVHQRERLLQALIPSNLRLDERSMQDLIAFVGKFAEQVRFWNQDDEAQGDWTTFWESDDTTLFAIMAAVDLENLRTEYRSLELQYLRLLKAELENPGSANPNQPTAASTIRELVDLIFGLALKVAELCQKAPIKHPIFEEYQRIVASQLCPALKELIAFHKGSVDETLLEAYASFIGNAPAAQAWGLSRAEDFLCIDYVLPDENREDLWRLFLRFYQALVLMVDKATRAFRSSLRSRDDHAPHITLFLTFLHLFRYLQEEMNRLPERHLLFYYEDVLRLQQRQAIPDKVHVVFELAQNVLRYRLKEGTLFPGGTDQGGKLRVYGLEDEVVVGQVKLVEKKNYHELKINNYVLPIALHDASKKDGVALEYKTREKAWHPFSGIQTFEWYYRQQRKESFSSIILQDSPKDALTERSENPLHLPLAKNGLLVSSPLFKINGELNENGLINISIDSSISLAALDLSIYAITNKGQIKFNKNASNLYSLNSNEQLVSIDENIDEPCIVIYPNNPEDKAKFERKSLNGFGINIVNSQIKGLAIQNGDTVFPEQAKVTLVGGPSGNTEVIYVRVEELFNRPIASVTIDTSGIKEEIDAQILIKDKWYDTAAIIKNFSYNDEIAEKYSSRTKVGFIKLAIKLDDNEILSFSSEQIKISYVTNAGFKSNDKLITFYHLHPFGFSKLEIGNAIPLYPTYEQPTIKPLANQTRELDTQAAHGNLFLGFEALLPNQTLNLLFKMAEGTGNPDHVAPEVIWSYLRDNDWVRFPPQFILKDETLGMKQTGIIRFQIPEDINNGNTWIKGKEDRTDLFWLRASATEFPDDDILVDALPMLVDIHVNAGTAVFKADGNTTEHLEAGLPAETIAALRFRDVNVKRVEQPYTSFGGRLSEVGDRHSYYRRIHERLRHRQRAISVWDYERIVLEKFPKVALAKCLSHTQVVAAGMPGHVTLAAVPYPDKMIGNRKYYPNLDAGDLEAIRQYLNRHNSYFVGGYGSPGFCCCHEEEHDTTADHDCHCGCGHGKSRLSVINARYEPIRLQLCVRFYAGKDIPFYTKQLNEDLKTFLAPWASDQHQPLLFGNSISTTHLLLFLENLDYVDVVMNLKIKHFASRTSADYGETDLPWSAPETIVPFTAASLLTTYLNRLDEDNPNVLDHEINVVSEQNGCACRTCLLEKVRLQVESWFKAPINISNTNAQLELTNRIIVYLNTFIRSGDLEGTEIPVLAMLDDLKPVSGQAFGIERMIENPNLIGIKISIAVYNPARFEILIIKPS